MKENMTKERKKQWKKWLNYERKKEEMTEKEIIKENRKITKKKEMAK